MAIWLAALVFAAGVVSGIAYAVLRAIALWRRLKRTGGTFGAEASRIADATGRIQTHLERASASSELLGEASGRLGVSRAVLDVRLQALREARHTMRRMLWFLPGV